MIFCADNPSEETFQNAIFRTYTVIQLQQQITTLVSQISPLYNKEKWCKCDLDNAKQVEAVLNQPKFPGSNTDAACL